LPETGVTGNGKDPGPDRGFPSEPGQLLPNDDKGILGYIPGPLTVVHIAHAQAIYLVPMFFIYRREIHELFQELIDLVKIPFFVVKHDEMQAFVGLVP
jgi:hypothetical protein